MTTASGHQRIVVGIDGSPEAAAALSWAIDEARMRGVGLRVLYIFPAMVGFFGATAHEYFPQVEKEANKTFEEALAAAPPMDDLDVQRRIEPGNPSAALVEESRNALMLVLGSRGRGAFREMLLGSVSMHCAHHAHCPVVIIRHDS
jgi:nucleotide-binding universal stress UspA family protein